MTDEASQRTHSTEAPADRRLDLSAARRPDSDSPPSPRPAIDLGLLVLRLGIGATALQAGLIKAADFSTTVGFMEQGGWRLPSFAALMVTASETLGGIGLLVGALTPLAACAVLGAMICAWAVNVSGAAFWSEPFNAPFLIGLGATALLFTGAGAYSVDGRLFPRLRCSPRQATALVVLAFVVAIATWVVLYGVNPIHVTAPPAPPGH
jgi:uncharacterized membrane protein YphA (DoxX/SURF4 family)